MKIYLQFLSAMHTLVRINYFLRKENCYIHYCLTDGILAMQIRADFYSNVSTDYTICLTFELKLDTSRYETY